MPPAKCAHMLSANKRVERVRSLIVFAKTASKNQFTSKLIDCWSQPHSTITEVRILLTLGADPEALYEDGWGQTELEERIEEGTVCRRCKLKYTDFLEHAHTIYEAQFDQTPVLIPRNKRCKSGMIALSLDGGGMRGLVSVVCTMFASRRIFGDEYLPNVVDWCVGTSAGSLMGLSLMKGMTLTETFFMYWDMKNEIFMEGNTMKRLFGNMVDRQSHNMDDVLLKCFPDEYTFMNCRKRLTVPALDITTTPAKLHVFRNYSVNIDVPEAAIEDTFFRDAARASSAAPTYFSPHVLNGQVLVDGSFVANCPLNIMFKELDQCNNNGSRMQLAAVISIGTGEPRATTRKYKSKSSNTVGRGKNIMYMSTLLLEQVVGYEQSGLESAMDRCQAQNVPLVRLSPKGVNVRIDQIDDGKLMDMIWTTLLYLTENTREVDKLGEILFDLLGEHSDKRVRSNTTL